MLYGTKTAQNERKDNITTLKYFPLNASNFIFQLSNAGFQYDFIFICIVKKIWPLPTNIYFCSIFFSGLIHSFT
jgi:hypothetical protein